MVGWCKTPTKGGPAAESGAQKGTKQGKQFTVSLFFPPSLPFLLVLMFLSVLAADDVCSVYWQGKVQSQ